MVPVIAATDIPGAVHAESHRSLGSGRSITAGVTGGYRQTLTIHNTFNVTDNADSSVVADKTKASTTQAIPAHLGAGISFASDKFTAGVDYSFYKYSSLDAGSDWMESWLLLGEEQCRALAELGTDFYLFESPWVGMNREGICRMVNAGDKVTMVGCYFDDHVRISLDAMGMGVVDWAVNDRSQPCNPDIYTFVTLHPGDEDKWD